jgi:hypothetical protein
LLFFSHGLADNDTYNNFSAKRFSRITNFPPDLAESANKKPLFTGANAHAVHTTILILKNMLCWHFMIDDQRCRHQSPAIPDRQSRVLYT